MLTVVLMVAFSFIQLRGQRLEKKDAENSKETIQQSQSTAIRVIAPEDLKIINVKMAIESNKVARHQLTIRNDGKISYKRVNIRFTYIDKVGRELGQKEQLIEGILSPGTVQSKENILIQNIPENTKDVKVQIAFGDIKPNE
jgi:hypothetical protein